MGKGDKKTKRGKIIMGSYGKKRPKRITKINTTTVAEKPKPAKPKKEVAAKVETPEPVVAEVPEVKPVAEKKKAAPKKAAAEKKTTEKKTAGKKPAEKKPAEKKPAEKKPAAKKTKKEE